MQPYFPILLLLSCLSWALGVFDVDENALASIDISKYTVSHVGTTNTKFYIDYTNDIIKSVLSRGHEWEQFIRQRIQHYVRPGSVAIDAGSHIGIHSMNMAKAVGPQGKVFAFEPQKKIYAEQYHNLRLNNLQDRVELRRQALGEEEKIVEMKTRNPGNEGGSAIGSGGDLVQMITLDSLGLNNVSFMKIDVEGYEANLLMGAKDTILRNQPVIIFENWKTAPTYNKVFEILKSYGYVYVPISPCDFLATPMIREDNVK